MKIEIKNWIIKNVKQNPILFPGPILNTAKNIEKEILIKYSL